MIIKDLQNTETETEAKTGLTDTELLHTIWGNAPGKRAILYKRGGQKQGGRNEFFDDNESAWNWLVEKNRAGFDVWFGLALFDGTGRRKQTNVVSVSSFWLDLDVGENKPYGTIEEATLALTEFCRRLAIPLPTLVRSGVGLHCHWVIDTRIDRERWETTAKALKNACGKLSLHAGPERTADIASVLRIPGTKHLKVPTDPKDVSLVGTLQDPISLVQFEQAFARYIVIDHARIINRVFETSLPQLPSDANKIANRCAVMREVRDTRGCVPEPVWYGALQVLSHCIDGERTAHEWSDGHEDYSHEATQEKFERASEFGPTLCSRFEEFEPTKCAVCPHRGNIATPLQLGVTVTDLVTITPTSTQSGVAEQQSEKLSERWITPLAYEVGKEGVYYFDADSDKRVPVLTNAIGITRVSNTASLTGSVGRFEYITRMGSLRVGNMDHRVTGDPQKLKDWLLDRGIGGINTKKMDLICQYFLQSFDACQAARGESMAYDHFGWSKDGFVLGDVMITKDGEVPVVVGPRVVSQYRDGMCVAGSLDAWARVTELLKGDRYAPHRFCLLSGLASVMLSPLRLDGSILSMVGDSGTGKTAIAQFALSAFGKWKSMYSPPTSTPLSLQDTWYVLHNLPNLINEANKIDEKWIDSLVMTAANAEIRKTMTQKSVQREQPANKWRATTMFTTNKRLLDFPDHLLQEAAKIRVLEIWFDKEINMMTRSDAAIIYASIESDYGHAGRALLQHLAIHRDELKEKIAIVQRAYELDKLPPEYRFRSWNICASAITGSVCEQLGIIRYDTKEACAWALESVKAEVSSSLTPMQKCDALAADYISGHQGLFSEYGTKSKLWVEYMRGECAGRYTNDAGGSRTVAIPVRVFVEYAAKRGIDKQQIERWVKSKGGICGLSVKLVKNVMSGTNCYVVPIEYDN